MQREQNWKPSILSWQSIADVLMIKKV